MNKTTLIISLFFLSNFFYSQHLAKFDSLKNEINYLKESENQKYLFKSFLYKTGCPQIDKIYFEDKDDYIWMSFFNSQKHCDIFYRFDGMEFEDMSTIFSSKYKDTLIKIIKSEDGIPFFLGKKGVAKWNGINFEYQIQKKDIFKSIYCKSDATYYSGNKGIIKWSPSSLKYSEINLFDAAFNIRNIELIDSKNRIWVSISDQKKNKNLVSIGYVQNSKLEKRFKIDGELLEIYEDRYSNIWILTRKQIICFKESYVIADSLNFPIKTIYSSLKDQDNNIWVYGETKRKEFPILLKINNVDNNGIKSNTFSTYHLNDIKNISLSDKLFYFKDNIIVVINKGNKDYIFNTKTCRFILVKDFAHPYYINSSYQLVCNNINNRNEVNIYSDNKIQKRLRLPYKDQIRTILQTKYSNYILKGTNFGIYTFYNPEYKTLTKEDGLIDNNVNKLYKTAAGIFAEYSNEIRGVSNIKNTTIQKIIQAPNSNEKVTSFLFEHKGEIWLKSEKNVFIIKNNEWINFNKKYKINAQLLLKDKDNNIWFYDKCLSKLVNDKILKHPANIEIKGTPIQISELDNNIAITTIIDDTNNSYVFNKETSQVFTLKGISIYDSFKIGSDVILSCYNVNESKDVIYIIKDSKIQISKEIPNFKGRLFRNENTKQKTWFFDSKGLILYENKKWSFYGIESGLPGGNLNGTAIDAGGNLWFAFKGGLTKYNSRESSFITYSEEDGLPPTGINDILIVDDGYLWLATDNGIIKFIEPKLTAKPVITEIKVDSTIYYPNQEVILPYNKYKIEIKYKAVTNQFPGEINYSYILVGFNKEWSSYKNDRSIIYENLPYGKYTFKLKALLKNHKVIESAPIYFEIKQPWYTRWVVRVAALILIFILLFLIYKWRTRALLKRQKILEQIVKERTAKIQQQNEMLQQQKDEITFQCDTVIQQKDEIEFKNSELHQANEEITTQRDEITAQRDIVTDQKNKIEKIHHEISQSINYATLIQIATLPEPALLDQYISEHFVLFKPKDKVSGDFYWWAKIENNLIITVADSTGHGVPGAFMSMLGTSFLREIVVKEYITRPALILKRMRKEIIHALKQKGGYGEQKDGMDMALISINIETMEMQFAGANNPIYFIRNGEFKEYKGDKMPVAIYENMQDYSNFDINLQKGDCLYLMSDGYQDQFGGPNRKKFLSKKLKNLLAANSQKSMAEQKEILETNIIEWMDNGEQIDDITIMGIRI